MEQIVVRIIPGCKDVELLIRDGFDYPLIINTNEFMKILYDFYGNVRNDVKCIDLTDSNIFFIKQLSDGHDLYFYKFEERILYPTYQNKIFKHMHPNTVFLLDIFNDHIYSVKAFIYKEWNALDTKLYSYKFPNMLGGNRICIGTIDKKLEDTILNTILKIVEGNYTADVGSIINVSTFDYEKCESLNYNIRYLINKES